MNGNNNFAASAIIIHWNTPELLKKQLAGLVHDSLEIIVVDNNSSGWNDAIRKEFPAVRFIRNRQNRGFAMACNIGASQAAGKWLLFLNPDVQISSEQIFLMINGAETEGYDACSPVPDSDNYRKTIPTGNSLLQEFTPLGKLFRNNGKPYTLTGGCLLIKNDVLKKIGGWDERFFIWFEDSDLSKRLNDNNFKIGWIDIKISHEGGASFKQLNEQVKRDIFFHSMDVYAQKHFSVWGKMTTAFIRKRYSKRKVLPILQNGASITVPNMKPEILTKFLSDNQEFTETVDELIIVSSGISGDEFWNLRRKYPDIRFVVLEKNRGVASTINIGMRVSTGRWIGTVNDDTILTQNWIQKCLEHDGADVGVLNPLIYHPEGDMETAGVKVFKKGKAVAVSELSAEMMNKSAVETDAVNGAVVLYKNKALQDAGLFDERFGSYLEDIDLSLGLKRKGWKNIVCLDTKVIHIGHATSAQTIWKIKPWLDFRNWIYVILKNWSFKDLILHAPEILIERLRNVSGIIKAFKN